MGRTEPHNYHLPYLTDCILSHDIAVDAAQRLLDVHGLHAMVMPPITMGSQNPGQRALPFCVHTRYETQKGHTDRYRRFAFIIKDFASWLLLMAMAATRLKA